MRPEGEHAGKGTKAHGADKKHGPDHLVDGAGAVHKAARGLVDPGRHDVGSREDAQGNGADDGEQGSPHGHLDGDEHLSDVVAPVGKVRGNEVCCHGFNVAAVLQKLQRVDFSSVPGPDKNGEDPHYPGHARGRDAVQYASGILYFFHCVKTP